MTPSARFLNCRDRMSAPELVGHVTIERAALQQLVHHSLAQEVEEAQGRAGGPRARILGDDGGCVLAARHARPPVAFAPASPCSVAPSAPCRVREARAAAGKHDCQRRALRLLAPYARPPSHRPFQVLNSIGALPLASTAPRARPSRTCVGRLRRDMRAC